MSATYGLKTNFNTTSPKSKTKEYKNKKARDYYNEHRTDILEQQKLRHYADLGMDYVKEIFGKYDDKTAKRILRMKRAVNELKTYETLPQPISV